MSKMGETSPQQDQFTIIFNIGLILSGDISSPVIDADTIIVKNGIIDAIGKRQDFPEPENAILIDAQHCVVAPGLIDNHVHPVAGDWTPRQNQVGWIESTLHGGVTTMISAGEAHYPGRPRDVVGVKALGIAAQRSFAEFRPGGMKIVAGAPVLEPGMEEKDFKELADAGVTLIGEVGLGRVKDGPTGRKMIGWARKYGMTSMTHTGGPSIPGSGRIGADVVLEVDADVVAHVNGGPTAIDFSELKKIVEQGTRSLEIVHNGNLRAGLYVLGLAKERDELARITMGTDGPAGSGVQPLGMLRTITHLASLSDVSVETIFCFATGNVATVRNLHDRGMVAVGRCADLVFMDQALGGAGEDFVSSLQMGNLPGIGMIMIDGVVRIHRSRNTPPADKVPAML